MQGDRDLAKIGRNERCPCTSGKKYKHCHGKSRMVRPEEKKPETDGNILRFLDLFDSANPKKPEVTSLLFNFDGTITRGLGDPPASAARREVDYLGAFLMSGRPQCAQA